MDALKTTLSKLSVPEAKATIDGLQEKGIIAEINLSIKLIDGGVDFTGPKKPFEQMTMSEIEDDDTEEEDE